MFNDHAGICGEASAKPSDFMGSGAPVFQLFSVGWPHLLSITQTKELANFPRVSNQSWPRCRLAAPCFHHVPFTAKLKSARQLPRIRPGIFDIDPEWGLTRGQTTPKISGTVPTNRHTTIPNDSGPISARFGHDPQIFKLRDRSAKFCLSTSKFNVRHPDLNRT